MGGGRFTGGYTLYISEKPTGNFRFVTLPRKIPEKKSFYRWKFCKFVWHPLEIPKLTKTHGNSVLVFLEHSWNSTSFLIDPLNFHVFSSRLPPEIPCPQSPPSLPVWIFSGKYKITKPKEYMNKQKIQTQVVKAAV